MVRRKELYSTKPILLYECFNLFCIEQGHYHHSIPTNFLTCIHLFLASCISHIKFTIFQSVLNKNIHKQFKTKFLDIFSGKYCYVWKVKLDVILTPNFSQMLSILNSKKTMLTSCFLLLRSLSDEKRRSCFLLSKDQHLCE